MRWLMNLLIIFLTPPLLEGFLTLIDVRPPHYLYPDESPRAAIDKNFEPRPANGLPAAHRRVEARSVEGQAIAVCFRGARLGRTPFLIRAAPSVAAANYQLRRLPRRLIASVSICFALAHLAIPLNGSLLCIRDVPVQQSS